jgi:hypothetical protein
MSARSEEVMSTQKLFARGIQTAVSYADERLNPHARRVSSD